ncbi:MAG: cobalamin biosynthesis protein [Dehalococcoidia bacterium]|nr:Cobalamin biosynthesis protein CobD [Chloroflexota bacterium]MBT9159422.1 Cobalamin biosynthesis protein CobD [Chloroflexota bacterium]MBT9162554.1 Cobalamin biosynthesis protein CobD [Chloroflexota bacterium]
MDAIYILLLSLIIDLALGEPPTAWHPVGWTGKFIALLERFAPRGAVGTQFLYGTGMVLLGLALLPTPAYFILAYLEEFNRVAYIIGAAVLLKLTFSIRELRCSALEVKRLLKHNDLQKARVQMRALVGRNTEGLSSSLLVAATVESVAENTSDSFVAPLFFFLLLGVPGTIAYRVANTFDSMIGYRGKYEYLGKFAARLDDVLNFIPARLTGLMMVFAALLSGKSAAGAWHTMLRDHAKVESPNAGWPMSAAAGALGVQLEKVGHYKLGEATTALTPETIDSALLLMWLVAVIWVLVCLILSFRF